jgi:hypothetical protein
MTDKDRKIQDRKKKLRKLLDTKVALKTRVQNGEKLRDVAKELGVKIVQPV